MHARPIHYVTLLRIGLLAPLFLAAHLMAQEPADTLPQDTVAAAQVVRDTIPADTLVVEDVHPQDAPETGFVLVSSDGEYRLRFTGIIRLVGLFDLGGLLGRENFDTYEIPVPNRFTAERRFAMDARQSRLGLEGSGRTEVGDVSFRLEGDFVTPNTGFRLRHAYASLNWGTLGGFLIGQTWTTFSDVSALPLTVDFEGPNSAISFRTAQARFRWFPKDQLRATVAIETPNQQTSTDSTRVAFQSTPDFIGQVRWLNPWGHLQLAGVFRVLDAKDTQGNLRRIPSGGGTATGRIGLGHRDFILYQAVVGHGISRYVNVLSGRGLDLIENPETGDLEGLFSWGGYVSYQRDWVPGAWLSAFVAGITSVTNKAFQTDNAFKRSSYFTANPLLDSHPGHPGGPGVELRAARQQG
jgi:hypothetical protein